MKVALVRPPEVNPYWTPSDPPLGIGYLSSYLRSNEIDCKIFDANFNSWSEAEVLSRLSEYGPDMVGLSSMTHEICMAHSIASKLKGLITDLPVVVGGCHVTALPKETMVQFPNFTYGVSGEGEKTFLELVKYLRSGKDDGLGYIEGLIYRDDKSLVVQNRPRKKLTSEELDALPYPAMDQYYKDAAALSGKEKHYVMMASRGCPYSCAFCMQVLGREVRRRSPENIVNEMEYAAKEYGANTIFFVDEIFLYNDKMTYQTFDLIKKRGLPKHLNWRASTRVDIINEELLRSAKDAGCSFLVLGVESGSPEILKAVNKQITVEQTIKAVELIKKAGIRVSANFILGHPNETPETVKATVDLAVKLNTDVLCVGIMVPYPGTKIYEMAKRGEGGYKLLTEDWSKYDKYGGGALELDAVPLKELEKWQRRALLYFYVNYRSSKL